MAEGQQPSGQQREEDVELLFDGQAPEVLYRRGSSEEVAVRRAREYEPPVGDVRQCREAVRAEVAHLLGCGRELPEHQDERQCQERCRQEPSCPSCPERTKVDAAGALGLREQQRGDQVAREGEEGGDTQEAALRPAEPAVEAQHAGYGQPPKPVERRVVGKACRRGGEDGGSWRHGPRLGDVDGLVVTPKVRGVAHLLDPMADSVERSGGLPAGSTPPGPHGDRRDPRATVTR